MKRTILPLMLAALIALAAFGGAFADGPSSGAAKAPAGAPVVTLDLPGCVELALRNSPALAKVRGKMKEAEGKVMEVQTGRRPWVEFEGSYNRIDPTVDFELFGTLMQVVEENNWDIKGTFQYLLSDFGYLGRMEDAMRYNLESVRSEEAAARNDLVFRTREAYFAVLKTQAMVTVARDFLESARAHHKAAQDRYKVGTVAKYDVLRADAAVEEAMQQVIAAENAFDLSRKSLLEVMGLDFATVVETAPFTGCDLVQLDLEAGSRSALENRPELKQLGLLVEMGASLVAAAGMERNPKLMFTSQYDKWNSTAFTKDYQWQMGVSLTVPLYDQGKSKAKTVQAKGSLEQIKATYEDAKRKILLEVQQAFLAHRDAAATLEVTKKRVASSSEAKKVADIRYKAGVSTNIEALDAQADLTRARAAHVNAMHDYTIACARWEKATGAALTKKGK